MLSNCRSLTLIFVVAGAFALLVAVVAAPGAVSAAPRANAHAAGPAELSMSFGTTPPAGPLEAEATRLFAFAAKMSQVNEAEDDYWKVLATGLTVGDLPNVFQDARDDFDAALIEADDILQFRLALIPELGNAPYAPAINPADFSPNITNNHLPRPVNRVMVYEKNTPEGLERIEVGATDETITLEGVVCRVIRDVVHINGELIEDTVDWVAQHTDGSVWYFGEIAKNYEEGLLDNLDGSWRYGKDDAQPGILMPANPTPGPAYRQEVLVNEAEDMARVVMTGVTVTVPAGTFTNCIVTEDFTPLDPGVVEFKYYAPGVGLVREVDPDDPANPLELIAILD